ncbi:Hypothetical predicted protein [Cloeon dipterum]|uniref:Cathepsin L n=1 Tax=Cloeon dipterum TaxID=197152 RepID=A0A8S1DG41_9INSE|nr:Hypothetical predicted protein [Cloeon dipterum]
MLSLLSRMTICRAFLNLATLLASAPSGKPAQQIIMSCCWMLQKWRKARFGRYQLMSSDMNLLLLVTVAYLCALGSFAKASECRAQRFVYFIRKYNKEYSSPAEYFFRMRAYMRHCREIHEHNERYKKGLETFEMEINQFADSYEDERYFTGELPTDDLEEFETLPYHFSRNIDVPKEVDWRSKGVVTPVKDQNRCLSCWAFGATAVVESQYVLQTRNKLTVLSEQSLVDCDTHSSGCNGGSTFNALEFVMKHGIAREEDYPYTHVQGVCQCKEKGCSDHPKILKILRLRSNSEEELMMVVAFLGPVAFNFDGTVSFMQYKKGVYSASDCRANRKSHSMAIVGYGTENGQDYWLVKNAWGSGWGDKGYAKIARNKNNFCGIANYRTYFTMKLLLLFSVASLCALGSFAKANECRAQQFFHFIRKYNKEYSSPAEFFSRMRAYMKNCREIYEHNERYKKGLETFEKGINQFADFYEDERYFTGQLPTDDPEEFETLPSDFFRNKYYVPNEVDWRSKGVVTPVKDQGPCASCWAFGATAALESHYVIQMKNNLTDLSEQSLLDCDTNSDGCNGGYTSKALEFVMKHGIAREVDYPYTHVQGVCQCKEKGCSDHPKILKIHQLRSKSEMELMMVVTFLGPVAFNFDGAVASFQQYKKGVYSASDCRANSKNHSLAIVGYGTENGQDYWLVKNSWGSGWGDKGYIKIARNKNNFCGIANDVFVPLYRTTRP